MHGSMPTYVGSVKEYGVPTKKVEVYATHGQTIPPRTVEKSVAHPGVLGGSWWANFGFNQCRNVVSYGSHYLPAIYAWLSPLVKVGCFTKVCGSMVP